MKSTSYFLGCFAFVALACRSTVTGPTLGPDLISNPSFEVNGSPSLVGWIVPDSSTVRFSADTPPTGSGNTIVLQASSSGVRWPGHSIYTLVVPRPGFHRYKLSILGKRWGAGGGVLLFNGYPNSPNPGCLIASLSLTDTIWTSYSSVDTATTLPGDTLVLTIDGSASNFPGTTFLNTCQLQELK